MCTRCFFFSLIFDNLYSLTSLLFIIFRLVVYFYLLTLKVIFFVAFRMFLVVFDDFEHEYGICFRAIIANSCCRSGLWLLTPSRARCGKRYSGYVFGVHVVDATGCLAGCQVRGRARSLNRLAFNRSRLSLSGFVYKPTKAPLQLRTQAPSLARRPGRRDSLSQPGFVYNLVTALIWLV